MLRDFERKKRKFNCDGSVTYFSAFWRRRRKPIIIEKKKTEVNLCVH